MSKKLNVGVIGCGQIAQIMHLPYLHDAGNFTVYALCDLSEYVVNEVGLKYGVPDERRYTDMDCFLKDNNMDAVLICNRDHYEPAVKAAKAGKHILVEKPFAFNVEQADEIIKAAKDYNVKLMVGYMKRYDLGYEYAFNKIKALKDISLVRVHDFGGSFDFTTAIYDLHAGKDIPVEILKEGKAKEDAAMLKQVGEERKQLVEAYSLLLGLCTHDSVLLRHAFGNEGKVVFADVYQGTFVTAVIDYGSFKCVWESGLVMNRYIWDEKIHVYSGDCNLSIEFPWPYLKNAPTVVHMNENENNSKINQEKQVVSSFDEAYRCEWQHFYDCITNDKEPITGGEEGRKDLEFMSNIIRAVKL